VKTGSRYDASERDATLTALIFASVLSGSVLIPSVRPFFATVAPGHEGGMHAFMALNMLGAIVGAPFLAAFADRSGARKQLAVALTLADAALLLAMAWGPRLSILLSVRLVQGAANVGALSLLLGGIRGRRQQRHGRAFGAAAAAMIAAVAAGGPAGTLLLAAGPRAPLFAAAMIQLLVAGVLAVRVELSVAPTPRAGFAALSRMVPAVKGPALWVAIERFAVGTFVVTFSLYAHRELGLGDRHVGALMSCFLVPFALASYPMGRLADRLDRGALLFMGMATYGVCFVLLGLVRPAGLPVILILTGVASAAIYSPSLCLAAALPPEDLRATSMALVNVTGSVGMMAGTVLAGALSAALRSAGWGGQAYTAVFVAAGCVQLACVLFSWSDLARLGNADALTLGSTAAAREEASR